MLIIFARTLIIFASILFFMRLLGKRQLRELELSELVVSVLIADVAATPLQDIGIPLLNGLIPIITLFACELIISGGILSSVHFRSIMCGKPEFLIIDGKIQEKEMRKAKFSVDELFEAAKNGTLEEVFGTGTAAVISPVGHLRFENNVLQVKDGGIGELSKRIYDTITGIQLGEVKDEFGWTVEVK